MPVRERPAMYIGSTGSVGLYPSLVAIGAALSTVAVIGWVFVRAMQRPARA